MHFTLEVATETTEDTELDKGKPSVISVPLWQKQSRTYIENTSRPGYPLIFSRVSLI